MIENSAIGLLGTGLSLFSPATKAATDSSTGANSFIATLFNTQIDSPQAFQSITQRSDISNIPPYEIDELAPVQETGTSASNNLIQQSQIGGENYTSGLNADEPANIIDAGIVLMTRPDVVRQTGGSDKTLLPATSSRLSTDTMRTLIAMQG